MKSMHALAVLAVALMSGEAMACSPVRTMKAFVPDRAEFERLYNFPLALDVPAPLVKVAAVRYASSTIEGNCSSYTWLDLAVTMPPDSKFSIRDVGLVFRAPTGHPQDRFMSFPNYPVTSINITEGGVAHFTIGLRNSGPTRSGRPAYKLEIFAINSYLQVGPSSFVSIGNGSE